MALAPLNKRSEGARQTCQVAKERDADASALQLRQLAAQGSFHDRQQRRHLGSTAPPVVCAEGEHGEGGDPEVTAALYNAPQRVYTGAVAKVRRQPPPLRPAVVTVQDDGHVIR